MELLFRKRDIRQLAILRIIIGTWFFVDLLSMLVSGYVKEAYVEATMNFAFYGFEWIKPLPGAGMYGLYIFLTITTIGIITGYRYRLSLGLFLIGFSYVFLCDIVYTLNKFYLFILLAIMLLFTDGHKSISVVAKNKQIKTIDNWQILIFQFLFALIYTLSGISKINLDWLLHAEPLIFFYKNKIPFKWLSNDMYVLLVYTFTYCGVTFDLTISWLLAYRKTNFIANILQALFHLLNFAILHIGSLSLFSIMITWLLFPTPWLKRKLRYLTELSEDISRSLQSRKLVIMGLSFFILINILIPTRHFIVGTEVNWTEKGHRFSWRLMTRAKRGSSANFTVVDNNTGEKYNINERKILTSRQYRKMAAETDLVLAFADYLKGDYEKRLSHSNISVYATVLTKLNGRDKNYLIDPELDLTTVSRSFLFDKVSTPLKDRYQSE
ncbi:MAG: HTTM domain-containing protein [Bacteroidota bacterium]